MPSLEQCFDRADGLHSAIIRDWACLHQNPPLDLADYGAVGGLSESLGGHAEEIYNKFTEDQKRKAESIFRRLTEVDESRENRRSATIEELATMAGTPVEEVHRVVDHFTEEGVSFLRRTGSLVDITHESLIRHWSRLRDWARQEAADRKDYEQVASFAATDLSRRIWLRGGHLDRAEEWLKKGLTESWGRQYRGDYKQTVKFIQRSLKQRARERRRAWLVACVSLVVAVVIAVLALQINKARRDITEANEKLEGANRRLTGTNGELQDALKNINRAHTETERLRFLGIWQSAARQAVRDAVDHADDDRTALLARQAMLFHRLTPNEPRNLVEDAVLAATYGRTFSHVLRGHKDSVESLDFSPDGNRLASASGDATVRIWDLRHPQVPPQILSGHKGPVNSVAFAPDGNHVASAGDDGTLRIWDLRQPQTDRVVLSGQRRISSVAFVDSNRLAFAVYGDMRLLDLRQPQTAPVLLPLNQDLSNQWPLRLSATGWQRAPTSGKCGFGICASPKNVRKSCPVIRALSRR
jgi:hypothetical protein